MKKLILIIFVYFLAGMVMAQSGKGYQLVVNKDNGISSISKDQLKKIYSKKLTKWDNDDKIKPVDLQKSSVVRGKFTKDVFNKSVSAMKAFWQRQIFSGKGVPPPEKKNDSAVIAYVKNNPGAIGYISANADISGLKKIKLK